MLALLQRVSFAKVVVAEKTIGEIKQGLLIFLGVEKSDNEALANKLLTKILAYRIFDDTTGKMNLNVSNINGGLLIVPQFTLAADTNKGLRPSFSTAAEPAQGKFLFDYFVKKARENYSSIATGEFGANMQITLCNDGPVTFLLKV